MPGVRMRKLGLLIAVWALLFAPGASDPSDPDSGRPDSDHITAAVLAPTFGSDAFTGGRSCGIDADDLLDDRRELTGPGPVAARHLTDCVGAGPASAAHPAPRSVSCRSATSRAPPSF